MTRNVGVERYAQTKTSFREVNPNWKESEENFMEYGSRRTLE